MRTIDCRQIAETVSRLFREACIQLPEDVLTAIRKAKEAEEPPTAIDVLDDILRNSEIASEKSIPLCQDTGVAVVFLEIGQEVHITGGDLQNAINEGVKEGYEKGFLRKSMVERPFTERINTSDNTPAVIHTEISNMRRAESIDFSISREMMGNRARVKKAGMTCRALNHL